MSNSLFGKTMVYVPNYHTTKFLSGQIIEINKTHILLNKPVYLGLSILELSKIVTYEFWQDYVELKYKAKAKLCYMDTDSFIAYIETEAFMETLQGMLKQYLILQIIKCEVATCCCGKINWVVIELNFTGQILG